MVGNKSRISSKSALSTPKPTPDEILRINVTLRGTDIPRWFRDWKRRGLVKSCSDAIAQSFRLYQERLTEFDLKKAQVKNLQKTTDEG
jgi:hypothetical protein